jgi:TM2 domain-containing membrane protein YozV
MFCTQCGSKIEEGTNICKVCGHKVELGMIESKHSSYGGAYPYEQKSRLAAGLLQIFLCEFAVGRFYLGYTQMAIAQLLVTIFTCGIGAVWPFIDGILILTGSVQVDGRGIPLKD